MEHKVKNDKTLEWQNVSNGKYLILERLNVA